MLPSENQVTETRSQLNILHLVPDDKFIPFVQRAYELAFPRQNQFRVFGVDKGAPLRFVLSGDNVQVASRGYWFSSAMKEDLRWCDCLIVHYMTQGAGRVVASAPPHVTVVWVAWGGDLYHLLSSYRNDLYLPETRRFVASLPTKRQKTLFSPVKLLKALGRTLIFGDWEKRALSRVDFASMLYLEHQMLAASVQEFQAKHFHFNWYYSAEEVFMKGSSPVCGTDILVGNSAAPSGNHAEIFRLLGSMNIGDRNVVVPLSYGDEDYADWVCNLGVRAFGNRFRPVRNFMPLDEYNDLISSCGTVFMNHVRQQAFGNICTALYKGARVYLRAKNPIFQFLQEKGVSIYEVPESAAGKDELFAPLNPDEVARNRQLLLSFLSMENVVDRVRCLASRIEKRRETNRV